jgi:hypothetical protein
VTASFSTPTRGTDPAQLTAKGYKEISRTVLLKPVAKMKAWPAPAFANRQVFARNDEELICASLLANPRSAMIILTSSC